MAVHVRIIFVLIISLLLTGCAGLSPANPALIPATSAAPAANDTGTATPDTGVPVTPPASTPTAEPTPAAIIEPALPLSQVDPAIPPINPPDFSQIPEMSDLGPFDLIDAHATYALYRQVEGPRYWPNDGAYIADMKAYQESKGFTLVQADGKGVSYSLLTRQTDQGWEMLLGLTPEGALAHLQPGLWGEDITQEWVPASNVLKGAVAIFIGADNLAYIARLGLDGKVYDLFNPIGATWDNLDDQWVPVRDGEVTRTWDVNEGAWVKNYDTTEYTGIFSEKYGEPEFTDSFIYTHASGIEVPIHIGLDVDSLPGTKDDLPVKEVHLTELGQELLGELWLAACYYRYTEIMGNDFTMEEYLELVEAGEGQVEAYFIDEITGEKKTGLVDPRNGVSITLTGRDDLPLDPYRAESKYTEHVNLSLNKEAKSIVVVQWNQEIVNSNYALATERKWTEGFFYSIQSFPKLMKGILYWAAVNSSAFLGQGRISGFESFSVSNELDVLHNDAFDNVSPQQDSSTPFASVK